VTKQLVTVWIGAAAAIVSALAVSGCAHKADRSRGPTVGRSRPTTSSSRGRRRSTEEGDDAVTELHLRDKNVYAYSEQDVVYALGRAAAEIQYVAPVKASGGVLRPPVELKDRVVFPTATTMEIYRSNGKLERRFPARLLDAQPGRRS
jgi:hypothetical protein